MAGIETGVRIRAARVDLVLTKGLVNCYSSGYQYREQSVGRERLVVIVGVIDPGIE